MHCLVIVESPAKIKKVSSYLESVSSYLDGNTFTVIASVGHFRDLPKKTLGFDTTSFVPEWVFDENKANVVTKMKTEAAKADKIYLATDPDREGEAISYHIAFVLKSSGKPMQRITFNEISPEAIKKAVLSPREIDNNLVQAQIGRRLIDRIVGYPVSGALMQLSGIPGLSAGRVQSVVNRILVERETDIKNFKKVEHYSVSAIFDGWKASLKTKPFLQDNEQYLCNKNIVSQIAETKSFIVASITEGEKKVSPPAPFITSTLQMACTNSFGLSPAETMHIAQKLYEDGLITYMRTDSPAFSDDAFKKLKDVSESLGIEIVETKRIFKSKGDAQEAHECIRPISFDIQSINLSEKDLPANADKVYRLIWLRAVASQMPDAIYKVKKIVLNSTNDINGITPVFDASGSILLSEGFKSLTSSDPVSDDEAEAEETIPQGIDEGSNIQSKENMIDVKYTEPKKRFTQASMVAYMEARGIGRPATYASILKSLFDKGYVEEQVFKGSKAKCLVPTDRAFLVVKALVDAKCSFIDIEYTRNMEEQLDKIAEGKQTYQPIVSQEYSRVLKDIESLKGTMSYQGIMCPTCKTSPLVKRKRNEGGYFWSCKNYQETGCKGFYDDINGSPSLPSTEHMCQICKSPLVRKSGKYGLFWGCTSQNCKVSVPDVKGKPYKGEQCGGNGCHGFLIPKKSAKGEFFGCVLYPECKFTCPSVKGKPKKQ